MTTPSKVKIQYTEGDPEKGASSLRSDSGLIVGGGVSDFTGERSHLSTRFVNPGLTLETTGERKVIAASFAASLGQTASEALVSAIPERCLAACDVPRFCIGGCPPHKCRRYTM